jgi:uncharacterized damage-inducible protein DinB
MPWASGLPDAHVAHVSNRLLRGYWNVPNPEAYSKATGSQGESAKGKNCRMPDLKDQLVETWTIGNRINLLLLNAIAQPALGLAMAARHRTVFQLFAHMHNVRLMWLKPGGPDLLKGLYKLEGKTGEKAALESSLCASGKGITELLRRSLAGDGKVKGFKPHAAAFVGYLISHESHHRGQIGWTLKNTGHPLDQKTAYGLWDWDQ